MIDTTTHNNRDLYQYYACLPSDTNYMYNHIYAFLRFDSFRPYKSFALRHNAGLFNYFLEPDNSLPIID